MTDAKLTEVFELQGLPQVCSSRNGVTELGSALTSAD
jgi:hypothetical protein